MRTERPQYFPSFRHNLQNSRSVRIIHLQDFTRTIWLHSRIIKEASTAKTTVAGLSMSDADTLLGERVAAVFRKPQYGRADDDTTYYLSRILPNEWLLLFRSRQLAIVRRDNHNSRQGLSDKHRANAFVTALFFSERQHQGLLLKQAAFAPQSSACDMHSFFHL